MTIRVRSFEYVPAYQGDEGLVLPFPEAATQTFVEGDLVYGVAGALTICGANPALILGIAKANASGITNYKNSVQVIRDTDVFRANFENAPILADFSATAGYELLKTAAGNWTIEDATTAPRVVILTTAEWTIDNLMTAAADMDKIVYCKFIPMIAGTPVLQFHEGVTLS